MHAYTHTYITEVCSCNAASVAPEVRVCDACAFVSLSCGWSVCWFLLLCLWCLSVSLVCLSLLWHASPTRLSPHVASAGAAARPERESEKCIYIYCNTAPVCCLYVCPCVCLCMHVHSMVIYTSSVTQDVAAPSEAP